MSNGKWRKLYPTTQKANFNKSKRGLP